MIDSELEAEIRNHLSLKINTVIENFRYSSIGGGSINQTYRIHINNKVSFFCKINSLSHFPFLFESEQRGIEWLNRESIVRVPKIISVFATSYHQVLVMEWIEQGLKTQTFWKNFGEQLAALHHVTAGYFGAGENNYMGALPQSNKIHNTWTDFLISERFLPQIDLSLSKKLLEPLHVRQFENLYKRLEGIFPIEPPSLLHGDLWSGNFLADENQNPVLIDPAVYMGHRSIDLGMTTLFGGFDKLFYESYNASFRFPANYQEQWEVCNLYPLLIHLNLFGKSYQGDILRTIKKYQ